MIALGFIKRVDVQTGKFYVNRELWDGFELDQKEGLVKTMSGYREAEHDLPQVKIYDSRSGTELASFSVFSGVTIR